MTHSTHNMIEYILSWDTRDTVKFVNNYQSSTAWEGVGA